MKVAFFGTPEICIPTLRALLASHHKIVCIVTQPDKPKGRGGELSTSAVKKFAIENNIVCFQPEKISREIEKLFAKIEEPDVIVTCAFGQILRQNVMDYCKYGVINVHWSLLPKYRGASPINFAIIAGEKKTGITIMQTDIGIDTGDIITQTECEIGDTETAGELAGRLSMLGADALLDALDKIEQCKATRTPQDHTKATYFPMLKKSDGEIDWGKNAHDIVNFVRGMNPWPCAWAHSTHGVVKIHRAHTEHGDLVIDIIQANGTRPMSMRDFKNGHKDFEWTGATRNG